MLNGGWPALLAALSFLLTANLFDPIFGDWRRRVLSHCPPHATPSLLPSPRSHSHHASSLRPPPFLRDGLAVCGGGGAAAAASQPPGLGPRNWCAYGHSCTDLQIMSLSHVVLPCLVCNPSTSARSLVRRVSVVEDRSKCRTHAHGAVSVKGRGRPGFGLLGLQAAKPKP